MARNEPRSVFGVHSVTPYNVDTGIPYGQIDVLAGATFALSGETIDLVGGSNKYPWQVADGSITAELNFTPREYPDFLFEVLLGKAPTQNSPEATGNVSTAVNVKGTSLIDATTGVASVSTISSSEDDLKFGTYVIEAVTSTTVNIYAKTDVDFGRGTTKTYEGDNLSILASNLTIATTTDVSATGFGFKLTGGSGTIGMTVGDTAEFEVRPINTRSSDVVIGGTSDVFPTFGCVLAAEKVGSNQLFMIDVYNLKAIGMPINMTAKEFSEAEITAKAFYSRSQNGVFKMRAIDA